MRKIQKRILAAMFLLTFPRFVNGQSFANVIAETISVCQNNPGFYPFHFSILSVNNFETNSFQTIPHTVFGGSATMTLKFAEVASKSGTTIKKYFLKADAGVFKSTLTSFRSGDGFSFETNSSLLVTDVVAKLTMTIHNSNIVFNLNSSSLMVFKQKTTTVNGKILNDYFIYGMVSVSGSDSKNFISIYISQVPIPIDG